MGKFLVRGLTCDFPDCVNQVVRTVEGTADFERQGEQAERWFSINRKDYCPDHADAARRKK